MRVKRLFRSPLLFPPKPPEADGTWANNPSRPASFLRMLRLSTAPLPAFFAAKRGFFAPNTRRTRPRRAPERPVLPRPRPFFARRAPEKDPAAAVFARPPRHLCGPLEPRKPPRVRLFCPPAPAFAAARRRSPANPPEESPAAAEKPPAKPTDQPVVTARRPKVSPHVPPRHSLGARQPRLPWSAFLLRRGEVCTPRGDQIPGHDG